VVHCFYAIITVMVKNKAIKADEKAPWWLLPSMFLGSVAFLWVAIFIFVTWVPLLGRDAEVKKNSAQTTGIVVSIEDTYLFTGSRGGSRVNLVKVEYSVAGQSYTADVIALRGDRVGEVTDIIYSVNDPSHATTEKTNTKGTGAIILAVFSGLLGLGGVISIPLVVWFMIKDRTRR